MKFKYCLSFLLFLSFSVFAVQNELPYDYPQNQELKIDYKKLGQCFAIEAQRYEDKMNASRSAMNLPYQGYTNFFLYLSASPKRDYYVTGSESVLRNWVLEQEDNSITPMRIFSYSLSLHQGNIWNAFLAIHELLRNEARYYDKRYYKYDSTPELQKIFFNKFVDIRGDLSERGEGFSGDHKGSWYRIWGMMLYRLMLTKEKYLDGQHGQLWGIDSLIDRTTVVSMGIGAEVFKYIKNGPSCDPDYKKSKINIEGGLVSHWMVKRIAAPDLIHKKDWVQAEECLDL